MNEELEKLLCERYPDCIGVRLKGVLSFYQLLVQENQKQNLTRLISPLDFVEGHFEDVYQLWKSGFIEFPAMDLGSGGGIPGLLLAVFSNQPQEEWILVESEGRKAEFLERAVQALGLGQVQVVADRGEKWLKENQCRSIVARAVGTVSKIYSWIGQCSTWNNLILLKGPRWEEEWIDFEKSKHGKRLRVTQTMSYTIGSEAKTRYIIRLDRN